MTYFSERLDAFPRIEPYRLVRDAGYWPFYKTVESASRPRITVEGREVINFGSNNYLSLSYHPKVVEDPEGVGLVAAAVPGGAIEPAPASIDGATLS